MSQRKADAEDAAMAEGALHRHIAAVLADDLRDDRQPQAGAASVPAARTLDAVETLEDAGSLVRRDADAGVAHADQRRPIVALDGDDDLAAGMIVANTVLDQVAENLGQ